MANNFGIIGRLFFAAVLVLYPHLLRAEPALYPVSAHSFELIDDAEMNYPLSQLRELQRHSSTLSAEISDELVRILGYDPTKAVLVRFVSPSQFRVMTGSLHWTGALFVPGQIIVPIKPGSQSSLTRIRRSLRHEYMHAAISELSAGRCPAWFEEGLAQLFEGTAERELSTALVAELQHGGPLVLHSLTTGFTRLPAAQVRAAYAQSLFAVRSLVNRFGFGAVRTYLGRLRSGRTPEQAFNIAFGEPLDIFEERLHVQLSRWLAAGGSAI